ncbi:threonine--tRNA ligase [bacterium]|nr:threonine--tRNA ligase [bacterium]
MVQSEKICIKLPNGKEIVLTGSVSPDGILQEHFPDKKNTCIAAVLNEKPIDLSREISESGDLRFMDIQQPEALDIFWHSSSHVMAQAVKNLYPDAQLGIGPSISRGFYYDFKLDTPITPDDLPRIEAAMQKIIDENQVFERQVLNRSDSIDVFKSRNEPFKVELIQEIEDEQVTVYQNNGFMDLCRGPHVPSTKFIRYFKLTSVAGSYWHGDERNAVMQRIYGISFPDKKQLKNHLLQIEEAKKRDHRKIGKELDLFSFHQEGPGFPFWHAHGMILYNNVQRYLQKTLEIHGYQEIKTPLILNEALWHQSGHWDNYKENMYFTSIDEQPFAVKPMNCPGGLLVFRNNLHSYKDFPIKMSEMGLVHRHEKSGVLHGLFRVRMFTQDDAHVFCTPEQIETEVIQIIDLIDEVYSTFGFNDYEVELSTKPLKSIGSDEMWQRAEAALENALIKKQMKYQLNPGDGAFYGPKIDYHIRDSLDRLWQCGTIQLDFSMPERFSLEYVGPDNSKHRPVMIHRAILGSVERFIGILIEHYAGDFPLWLAPVQCAVLPISEKHESFASTVLELLRSQGIRCKVDNRNEKIGFKIRDAETHRINYMCIIGDREVEEQSVSLRQRKKGNLGTFDTEALIKRFMDELDRRANH